MLTEEAAGQRRGVLPDTRRCTACLQELSKSHFSHTQLQKGLSRLKCKACTSAAHTQGIERARADSAGTGWPGAYRGIDDIYRSVVPDGYSDRSLPVRACAPARPSILAHAHVSAHAVVPTARASVTSPSAQHRQHNHMRQARSNACGRPTPAPRRRRRPRRTSSARRSWRPRSARRRPSWSTSGGRSSALLRNAAQTRRPGQRRLRVEGPRGHSRGTPGVEGCTRVTQRIIQGVLGYSRVPKGYLRGCSGYSSGRQRYLRVQ